MGLCSCGLLVGTYTSLVSACAVRETIMVTQFVRCIDSSILSCSIFSHLWVSRAYDILAITLIAAMIYCS